MYRVHAHEKQKEGDIMSEGRYWPVDHIPYERWSDSIDDAIEICMLNIKKKRDSSFTLPFTTIVPNRRLLEIEPLTFGEPTFCRRICDSGLRELVEECECKYKSWAFYSDAPSKVPIRSHRITFANSFRAECEYLIKGFTLIGDPFKDRISSTIMVSQSGVGPSIVNLEDISKAWIEVGKDEYFIL